MIGRLAVVVAVVSVMLEGSASAQTGEGHGVKMPPPSTITILSPSAVAGHAGVGVAAAPRGWVNNTRVNHNADSVALPQVEPSITSDPRRRRLMVSGYSDSVDDVHPGVARSRDGGVSWAAPSSGPVLPPPAGYTWGSRSSAGRLAGGDPSVSWSTRGTAYYATLGFEDREHPPSGRCDIGGLYVYRSTDRGSTWTLPGGGAAVANSQTVFVDKPYIAADSTPTSRFAGNVYAVWSDDVYSGCPQFFDGPQKNFVTRRIMFARSADRGRTWSTPVELASGCLEGVDPAVSRDGTVFVAWWDCSNNINREMVRRSTDAGSTWGPAVAAATNLTGCPLTLPGSDFRVTGIFPVIATDPTRPARVYLTYPDCPGGDSDIFFVRSADRAATWSAPIRVNDDPIGDHRDQFFPWMTVANNGIIRVSFGDDRRDKANPGGRNYDIYLAESPTHGKTFAPNLRVTSRMSDPSNSFGGTFIGDYFGIAACGTPVWTDTRNGNPDIFAAAHDQNGDGKADGCTR